LTSRTIILGAGIAGVAAAHILATKYEDVDVTLVDGRLPLSFTTSCSGENFRSFWPHKSMEGLVTRSLDLMNQIREPLREPFHLEYSGYRFVSLREEPLSPDTTAQLTRLTEPDSIHEQYPYLSPVVRQVVQLEQAGSLDVHGLGQQLLKEALEKGVRLMQAHVAKVERTKEGFSCHLQSGEELSCQRLVLASGPFIGQHCKQLGLTLPVENFLQQKVVLPDPLGIIPRDMPFTILADPQHLDWTVDEKQLLVNDPTCSWLLQEFPAGLHIKPESRNQIKLGWAFNRRTSVPNWDPPSDPEFASIVLRGASRFIPGLAQYLRELPTPVFSYSGYYNRTRENWPVVGPVGPDGLFVIGGLSGFGTMSACGVGELCADWIHGTPNPSYARHFHPDRYNFEDIAAEIARLDSDGQL
jgi:glycine/D-amino acid oxidase-like deaminating enzyme